VTRTVYGEDGNVIHDETWNTSYRGEYRIIRVGTKKPPPEETDPKPGEPVPPKEETPPPPQPDATAPATTPPTRP
jgi:hypothetical protein